MNAPGFWEGAAWALAASLIASALATALGLLLPQALVLRLLIAALGLAYVLYLLGRSAEKTGRLTTLAVWLAVAAAAWFWSPPWPIYLLAHIGSLWLVRSLYFHASLSAAAADLVLNGLALALALWAVANTASLFWGVWCFFLTQALFGAIPQPGLRGPTEPAADRFRHAHRAAEAALRRLSSPTL